MPQRKRRNSRKSSVNSNSTDDNEGNESSNTEPFFNVTNSDVNNTSFCGPSPTKLKNERKSPVKTLSNRKFNTPTAIKERRRSKGPKMAVFEINPTVSLYPSPEERKELVKCIHEKLKNSFCTTSTDLRKYISENSSNKFWFDLSEEFIESAVNESGGFRVQNKVLLIYKFINQPIDLELNDFLCIFSGLRIHRNSHCMRLPNLVINSMA